MNKTVSLALLCTAATAVGARISVPLPYSEVPLTLQTVVVCFTAIALGAAPGVLAMLLYLGLGALGLPVFAEGASGLEALQGPTGGYLVGFVLAQPAVGLGRLLFSGDRTIWQNWFAAGLGHLVILATGVAWMRHQGDLTWYTALNVGFWPFLLAATVKSLLAALAGWWVEAASR